MPDIFAVVNCCVVWLSLFSPVVFVLAPQHETSCDSEITTNEDFDYWRKVIEES